jgi:hypothetical protein
MSERSQRLVTRAGTAVLVILVLALLLWVVVSVPKLVVTARSDASFPDVTDPVKRHELQNDRLRLENDVRRALLQALGGLAVLAGVLLTWRQLLVSREGQVTERFTRAIDQLGSEKLDVRVGGIYALERIAHDSVRDRSPIEEILCAYIREHSPTLAKRMSVKSNCNYSGASSVIPSSAAPRRVR